MFSEIKEVQKLLCPEEKKWTGFFGVKQHGQAEVVQHPLCCNPQSSSLEGTPPHHMTQPGS